MKYIKIYESFTRTKHDDDTLYIFDFDDTIVNSPRFEELAIEYLKENENIGSLLKKSLRLIGKNIDDIKIEHGRLYVNDPNSEIEIKGNWVRKKNRVYLVAPENYYYSDLSLPKDKTELSEFYSKVKNKAIVTGRLNRIKKKIEKVLDDFGLENPNHGLYCYPSRDESGDKVPTWKGKTIVELIKKTGFKKVKFYDDNSKWVNKVVSIVRNELPEIDFEGIKVKNEK
jgi:hypothetical protein